MTRLLPLLLMLTLPFAAPALAFGAPGDAAHDPVNQPGRGATDDIADDTGGTGLDAVGRVNVAGYDRREMRSGTLIRPDLVLTAAHCLADPKDGYAKPLDRMVFVAGYSTLGHKGVARAQSLELHPKAFVNGQLDIAHDLGLIVLDRPVDVPGLPVGSAASGPFDVIGYTRSAPHRQSRTSACMGARKGTLWVLDCPVEKGQSGGPILSGSGAAQRVVGVIVASNGSQSYAVAVDRWLRAAILRTHFVR